MKDWENSSTAMQKRPYGSTWFSQAASAEHFWRMYQIIYSNCGYVYMLL